MTNSERTNFPSPPSPAADASPPRWIAVLYTPIDIASLAYFRVVFGLILLWEVYRYFQKDWIARYWIQPRLNFTYYGFDWVQPLPGDGMYYMFWGLGALAVMIAAGFLYRISIALFFLGFTYMFLLEQARYLNHFYLICLLSFIMMFLPLNRAFSIDAKIWPSWASDTVPAWPLWLLRFQLGVVYFYGGIAKLTPDWLRGEPMRVFLRPLHGLPVVGPYFQQEWMTYLFSYGGLYLDLLIVPLLLWKTTRLGAFAVITVFHITNDYLFVIGIFPWFMIAATALFFPPDWPRQFFMPQRTEGIVRTAQDLLQPAHPRRVLVAGLLAVYVLLQCLVPLRHHLYPGNPSWTEEGHRFSWRMKLRAKSGEIGYRVVHPETDTAWNIAPRRYLTRWQEQRLATHPDMILIFAHYLADEKQREGYNAVEVYADVHVALNGRSPRPFVDPGVNLAVVQRSLWPSPWIIPLTEPLRIHDSRPASVEIPE